MAAKISSQNVTLLTQYAQPLAIDVFMFRNDNENLMRKIKTIILKASFRVTMS